MVLERKNRGPSSRIELPIELAVKSLTHMFKARLLSAEKPAVAAP